jgi:hypothetical protein
MTAIQLYALVHNAKLEGPDRCHWCGSPCQRLFQHDGPPMFPFVKVDNLVRCPASGWVCNACWHFRKRSVTVQYLSGGRLDRQEHCWNSLVITNLGVQGVRFPEDGASLFAFLRKPPLLFSLALLTEPNPPLERRKPGGAARNHLQLMKANDLVEIKGTTPLEFTLDSVPHSYTIYELEEAAGNGMLEGKEPGVQMLLKLLGPAGRIEKRRATRPALEDLHDKRGRKMIAASGMVIAT